MATTVPANAAITVTRVECAPDLRDANVFISIFGHEDNRDGMIAYLNRQLRSMGVAGVIIFIIILRIFLPVLSIFKINFI